MELEQYLDKVVKTVQRVGAPENPTIFASGDKEENVVLLAGDDPVIAAHDVIRKFKPKMIVLTVQAARMPLVIFQAESRNHQIFRTYRVDPWQPVTGSEVAQTAFGNLLCRK